jgi:hypothetical protein
MQPGGYGIIKETPRLYKQKKNKRNNHPPHNRVPTTSPVLQGFLVCRISSTL